MVTQSRVRPVPLLLTRPLPQGAAFEAALRTRFGGQLQIVATPLMAPHFLTPHLPGGHFAALIITSQTGVEALMRLGPPGCGLPRDVYCVGAQTAKLAQASGLRIAGKANESQALIQLILVQPRIGRLLHLRGQDTRGDITQKLNLGGIDTVDAVIYAQVEQPLTPAAVQVLQRLGPVLVPLFSPRTAAIFTRENRRVASIATLLIAAISPDVVADLRGLEADTQVAAQPDSVSMIDAVAALIAKVLRA